MCGIAGERIFEQGYGSVDLKRLERMRDALAHRGPDGAGQWCAPDRRTALAHRRLAVLDLSAAADQPMVGANGDVVLSFNGQIYNHEELRRELTRAGRRAWRTRHSDTEVVLQAYEQWGIGCLERFRGMFALAIWDGRSRELWLVRDRLGVKPLYWAERPDGVVFASEIKALLVDDRQRRSVDRRAFVDALSFLTTPGPDTLFAGIRKLAPGTWLRFAANGQRTEQRWWDVWDHVKPWPDATLEAAAERTRELLRESVQLRRAADVPVGVFLSGGIDSSSNAALFAEGATEPVRTFSIGYDRDYASTPSELGYAREMARSIGAKHEERLLSIDDLLEFLPRMVEQQDEPIADPVCVPLYYVAELARRSGVTVCQVGEGADELFWGYPEWRSIERLERMQRGWPRLALRAGAAALHAVGRAERRSTALLSRAAAGRPLFYGGAEGFSDLRKERLLSGSVRREVGPRTAWDVLAPIWSHYCDATWIHDPAQWMTYLDLRLRLPELLLMRVDKMSMATSLEARVPFLDQELVAFALGLPPDLRARSGELKAVLRRAMAGIVPEPILRRPKQGFAVPIAEWFLDRLGPQMQERVEAFARDSELVCPQAVRSIWSEGRPWERWVLTNMALWWHRCIAS